MKKYILLTVLTCCVCALAAQDVHTQKKYSKLAPGLSPARQKQAMNEVATWWIVTTGNRLFKEWAGNKKLSLNITGEYAHTNLIIVQASWAVIDTAILSSAQVVFVDRRRVPTEELVINGFDNSTNKINMVHNEVPAINGQGMVVSVKENKPDTTDIDFKGRFLSTPLPSPAVSPHATIMTTIIGGAGNSYYNGRGSAWGTTLSSSDFASLLPDADAAYTLYGISVQNHSYGTDIENYYGADAAAYDASTIQRPSLLHVFSAGNSGNKSSTAGPYTGITGYANVTGSFKMSKNSIAVGSVDSFYNILPLSSRGPAYDGRIKPELVAFGADGSSGAAAIVSGTALLLQQAYKEQHAAQQPSSALVKAILLNTADDVGPKGPDFQSGYGSVHAYKAIKAMQEGHYMEGAAQQNTLQNYALTIPPNIQQVTITLCWIDPAAAANAGKALVNDLDMELVNNTTSASWRPWVLNAHAHPDSLQQLPVRKRDSLNNVEQISLENPVAGNYTIRISGYAITGSQPYVITYRLDTLNRFKWYYPTQNDNLYSNAINTLRWESTFTGNTGTLQYSLDNGTNWQTISNTVDAGSGWYRWQAPDTFATCLLRMTVNSTTFLSDTTTISARLQTQVGFHCTDSFLLTWNRPPGVSTFRLYQLGDRYLQPVKTVSDTAIVLQKSDFPSLHYTVAPVLAGGKTGLKTFTFNYTTQGAGCYVNNFLADKIANTASLTIELGTTQNIKRIVIEKQTAGGYIAVQVIEPVTSLYYYLTNIPLVSGPNTWRLRIELQSGSSIYSQSETVYYLQPSQYLVFPNPLRPSEQLMVIAAGPGNRHLLLYNPAGQKVLQRQLFETMETVSLPSLQKGIYFLFIYKDGKKEHYQVLVIQ